MSRKDYYFFLRCKAVLTECSLVHVLLRSGSADSSGSLKMVHGFLTVFSQFEALFNTVK